MENLRVRRAGFAYRRPHKFFLQRYKSLCPDTWPQYSGTDKEGVQVLVDHLSYQPDDYKIGKYEINNISRVNNTLVCTIDLLSCDSCGHVS